MNGKIKSLAILAIGLILGTGDIAEAAPFSAAMSLDMYNNNAQNNIPTPQYTPGLGYDIFNAANLLNPSYGFTKNENLDLKLVTQDSSLQTLDGSVVSMFVIGRSARNINNIGYYLRSADNSTIAQYTPLLTNVSGDGFTGTGTSSAPFLGVDFTAPASTIGMYIETTNWRNPSDVKTYYSEPILNSDGFDHLITYALPELKGLTYWVNDPKLGLYKHTFTENAYLIGFEDITAKYTGPEFGVTMGDEDFNEILILIDSTQFQPSPKPPLVPEPATFVLVGAGMAGLLVMRRRNRN